MNNILAALQTIKVAHAFHIKHCYFEQEHSSWELCCVGVTFLTCSILKWKGCWKSQLLHPENHRFNMQKFISSLYRYCNATTVHVWKLQSNKSNCVREAWSFVTQKQSMLFTFLVYNVSVYNIHQQCIQYIHRSMVTLQHCNTLF